MKLDQAFNVIHRINQTAIFLVILGLFLLLSWGITERFIDRRTPQAGEIAVSETKKGRPDKKILSFGSFHRINGTDVMTADISERRGGSINPINPYDSYSNKVNNVIFISTKENKVHMLFPHPNYFILSSGTVSIGSRYGDDDNIARGFVYQFVKADTNDNQVLDEGDRQTMGLAHADGTGAVEILSDFDHIISNEALDAETLSVIYQKGDKIISAHYSLKTLKPLSSTVITDLLAANRHG